MKRLEARTLQATALPFQGDATWLGQTAPELFREYLRPSRSARAHLLAARLEGLRDVSGAVVIEVCSGSQRIALMGAQPQFWDTDHFGVNCAKLAPACVLADVAPNERLEIHEALLSGGVAWAKDRGIRVLQRRLLSSRIGEIGVLEQLGFHMIDNVVTLSASLAEVEAATDGGGDDLTWRCIHQGDLPVLANLTNGAFPLSRFVTDRVLDAEKGRQLYVRWLGNLFADTIRTQGASDRGFIVSCREGSILGYCAFGIDRSVRETLGATIATIELIVVAPEAQGLGVGRTLLGKVAARASVLGADIMESSTWIGQKAALAANQKAGLRVCENLLTYHLYL